jgi:DNA polymerase-1
LEQKIPEFMKTAIVLDVPMEVGLGFGQNWLEAH